MICKNKDNKKQTLFIEAGFRFNNKVGCYKQ